MRARALGISGVNFCPGIRFWEVNFARALGFWQFDKKCVMIDKKVKNVTYLLKIFNLHKNVSQVLAIIDFFN